MMLNRIKSICFYVLPLTFMMFCKGSFAQNVSVSAALDSTLMVIGGQMNFYLEVIQPQDLEVVIPIFTDTITKNIEVIRYSKPDTVTNGNLLTISRSFRITSFDSGLHYIPPVEVEYFVGELIEKQSSQSLALLVVNPFVEVDPEKGFFDIKQPLTLPFQISEFFWIIKWIILFQILAAILILAIYWWLKKRNPIKEIFFKEKPKEPAHIIALSELDRIKSEKIWLKGQIKQYYTQLSDVLRIYMEERFGFSTMEQTTPEILRDLKNVDLPDEKSFQQMAYILGTADLAKFAKYEPIPDENDNCLAGAYLFVNNTIPKPEE